MLPTIDISLIGILIAIWNVVKVIWDWTTKAFNWLMHRALALLIGSKFWATAAFLTVAIVLITVMSSILNAVSSYILSLVLPSITLPENVLEMVGFFLDGSAFLSLLTFLVSCWAVYHLVIALDFSRRLFQRIYTLLTQGWKT